MDQDNRETPVKQVLEDECETPLKQMLVDDCEIPLKQALEGDFETSLKQVRGIEIKRATMYKPVLGNEKPGDHHETDEDEASAYHGMDLDLTLHDWSNPVNQVIIDSSRALMSDSQPRAMDYYEQWSYRLISGDVD